jgi:hypothetical protein
MKAFDKIVVIEEKLASFIGGYVKPLREGRGFEHFSDECILYALLEYSKFVRPFTNEQRLKYLYCKCGEYSGHREYVEVDFDNNGNFFIICEKSLPF